MLRLGCSTHEIGQTCWYFSTIVSISATETKSHGFPVFRACLGMLERVWVKVNRLCSLPYGCCCRDSSSGGCDGHQAGAGGTALPCSHAEAPSRGNSQCDTAPAVLEGHSQGRDGEEEAAQTSVTPRVLLLCSQARLLARVTSHSWVAVVSCGCRTGCLVALMVCSWCLQGVLQLSVLICAVWDLPTWPNAI